MRTARLTSSIAFSIPFCISTACVALVIACGDPPDTKTPVGGGDGGSAAMTPASGDVSSGGASGGTTTTSSLPDGGELQGAKLGSSTHSETTTQGDAGPKAGPGHQSEPGRSQKDIQTIIQSHRDEARACYDKGLASHPGIEGDLTIKWTVDPTGKVTDTGLDSTRSSILEQSVIDCISDVIKKIQFAPSKGGFETRASYPFNFHPKMSSGKDAGK